MRRTIAIVLLAISSTHLSSSSLCVSELRGSEPAAAGAHDFDKKIAPLLAQHCLACHSGAEAEGGLDLSDRKSAMRGGDSGVVIQAGSPGKSLLWQHVEADEMPPEDPLPPAAKKLLKEWLAAGARWGSETIDPFRFTTANRAGNDWWSLQPLSIKQPPPAEGLSAIDAYVAAKLKKAGLTLSKRAGKATLLRRLTFDLTGLPPTQEQIKRFAEDDSPQAYERLVDRLLASPHYGEHWARHWLDIVRFGESNGFEYDQPRDNAWHYRNWVINALNSDMPYDEFVRLQLAGDVLHPGSVEAAAAAGFLVAGAHNTTLPASSKMRMAMAQDELEDLTAVVGQTFLGLTVNCARCHDHKFDPISQQEYYQFAASLTGVTHGERTLKKKPPTNVQQRIKILSAELQKIESQLEELEKPVRESILKARNSAIIAGPQPPAATSAWDFSAGLDDTISSLHVTKVGAAELSDGLLQLDGKTAYARTAAIPYEVKAKTLTAWVKLNSLSQRGGGVISLQTVGGGVFDAIVFGEQQPQHWMAGSNNFVRTRPFGGEPETTAGSQLVHIAIVYQQNGLITGYRDGKQYGKPYKPGPVQTYAAGKSQLVFGMRHGPPGSNKMLAGGIQRAAFFNRALSAAEVAALAGSSSSYVSPAEIIQHLKGAGAAQYQHLTDKHALLQRERNKLEDTAPLKIYTCISKHPGVSHVLLRGNVSKPGPIVTAGGLQAVKGGPADFELQPDSGDADRRKKLADWITSKQNPLFARVIVNRLWQHHFGAGLVKTSSDFGFNGGQPSHPELLDWLAVHLQSSGYKLKTLHRAMLMSDVYRQSSAPRAAAQKVDAGNRLLWRYSPVRLSAESIRDAALQVAGKLSREVGGRGYRDVRHYKQKGSNFYEPLDAKADTPQRRTIYRFAPRGGRNPFLDTFDCPDPSATAPERASTTTPLQALALMNNPMMLNLAEAFASRIKQQAGEGASGQVQNAYLLAYGRQPTKGELNAGEDFVRQHGLMAFCRIIFNTNEFLYVR